jgi:hypothetical protein
MLLYPGHPQRNGRVSLPASCPHWCANSGLKRKRCKGELRECSGGYTSDRYWDESIALWHEKCDPHLTFTPTTPMLTPLSTTLDTDECTSIYDACLQRSAGLSSCSEAYSANITEAVSCLCRPSQLSAASRCFVDRTDCWFRRTDPPVTLSTVVEYEYCQPSGWTSPVTQVEHSHNSWPSLGPGECGF